MLTSCHFIVNPVSGSGRAKKDFERVRAMLDEAGVQYTCAYTDHPKHAVELTKAAVAEGAGVIVAVGGDGTVNEVASVLGGTDVILGILPFGTGNDFSQAFRIPKDTEGAVQALLNGVPRKVDAARGNGCPYINVAGFGFDVDVVKYTEKYKKRLNGMLPYLLGIFQSLMHLKPVTVTITPDEGEPFEEDILLFAACNGVQYAGGIRISPLADPADGLLDICLVRSVKLLRLLKLLPTVIKGKHLSSPHIVYFKARKVEVDAPAGMELDFDGELSGSTPVTFEVMPGALTLLLPPAEKN